MLAQGLQGQGEYPLVKIQAQPLANDGETGMIGRLLIQFVIEKCPDRHRIGAARRDGAFARQIFEKPDHDHLKVNDRIYTGTTGARLLVGRGADLTHFGGKSEGLQGFLELRVEGGLRRFWKLLSGHPELRLHRFFFIPEHASYYSNSAAPRKNFHRKFELFNRLLWKRETMRRYSQSRAIPDNDVGA